MGIVFTPREGGNSEILAEEALAGARHVGAETELLITRDKNIRPCDGCRSCLKTGECHIIDDMQPIYKRLLEADGIIFSTPVYMRFVCGQAKIFLDRTFALGHPYLKLANKVGGAIAVATRTGAINALSLFYLYFVSNHMIAAEFVDGMASEKGGIRKDERAVKSSWELGRQVALLIKQQNKFPEEFDVPLYRFWKKKRSGEGNQQNTS